jgi:exopolysaccharide production protein ExoQ
MPPAVALLLCAGFIFWLFRKDMELRRASSNGVWIAGVWLAVISSRPVSYWLSLVGIQGGATSNLEGSPLDLAVFLGLMVAAVVTLGRRGFNWGQFSGRNKALVLIYAYLVLSAVWAEHGFPTLKRAVKDFGMVLVALVLLTEAEPLEAIRIVFVRVSYLLFPLSVVLIKWFPELGRTVGRGGDFIFSGVCEHKSSLGCTVLVMGLMIVVDLVAIRDSRTQRKPRIALWIRYGMIAMTLWLLLICQSATGLICFVLGSCILWGTKRLLRLGNPRQMIFRCLAVLFCLVVIEETFDVSTAIMTALGKNRTLSGRTEIWDIVEQAQTDPLLGSGFYSFWESGAADTAVKRFAGVLNTAHNGYLEMYLDGGLIGVGLLIGVLLAWGRRSIQRLLEGSLFGRTAFMFWVLAILFNNSETSFFRFNSLWFALLLTMVACPDAFCHVEAPAQVAEVEGHEATDLTSDPSGNRDAGFPAASHATRP